ncbi:hypothetical protein IPL68_02880 [Candidatus Saccharibacteria bacterium]|nr:MAG: hypothetical protein IPL68_02880 [Candidatus Saccharibacteria bacterium]
MQEQQPGQVITPGTPTPQPVAQPAPPEAPAPVQQQEVLVSQPIPQPIQQPAVSTEPAPQSPLTEQPLAPLAPASNDNAQPADQAPQNNPEDMAGEITWTAAEYLHHEKNSTWYGAYALGAILLGGAIFFITRDAISTAVVIGAVGGLLFISSREPKQQGYTLQEEFIQVGKKLYSLRDFKAFSVDEESPVLGVTLAPLKRFMPPVVLYIDEAHEEAVVDYIANFLPIEPHKVDAMDSLLLRF